MQDRDGKLHAVRKIALIAQVNFTYAIPGGMWIRRADATTSWETFESIIREVGEEECQRLRHVAHEGGMCGMWYHAATGNNVYVNGVYVA